MELSAQSDRTQVPEGELYQHINSGPRLCSNCNILTKINSWSNANDRRAGNVHLLWIEDRFPRFIEMGIRATRGCEVCRFLREILVNHGWNEPGEGVMYMHLTAGRSWESGALRYTNMVLWHHMGNVKEKGFFHFDLQSDNGNFLSLAHCSEVFDDLQTALVGSGLSTRFSRSAPPILRI
jgi:hypothetical protein